MAQEGHTLRSSVVPKLFANISKKATPVTNTCYLAPHYEGEQMDVMGFVFGMSGFTFGLMGFISGMSASQTAKSAIERVEQLEERLSDNAETKP